uniref:Alpha-galactosidase n=1 Tax=Heterorhabditis bacteriophora TaxID=37862 RepID=A0A1I7WC57_HETBA
MTIVEQLSIGRVWQEEGERNGVAFWFSNGTDPSLQIPLQTGVRYCEIPLEQRVMNKTYRAPAIDEWYYQMR